jgi:ribosomal protein L37AE/L43A
METTVCPECGSEMIEHHDEDNWKCMECDTIFPKEDVEVIIVEGEIPESDDLEHEEREWDKFLTEEEEWE